MMPYLDDFKDDPVDRVFKDARDALLDVWAIVPEADVDEEAHIVRVPFVRGTVQVQVTWLEGV
jgi:hypothetical protein